MSILSQRAQSLKPSPTMAMAAKAKELQAAGNDVVSLTVGEPDWQTIPVASQAAIEAIQAGFTKYTVVSGIPELKTAISNNTQETLGVKYGPKEITVGAGAKYVIFAALQMLIDTQDEVIIPAPFWVSYPTMVELAGGKPVLVSTEAKNRFKLTAEELRKAITPKTKMLLLCSPSNPTGIMYSKDELKALAQVLLDYPQILILSDDIYNRLVFTGEKVAPHFLNVAPELRDRMILVNGASKAYSMTGWRIGWGMGPEKIITAMSDYMSQSTSNATSISQKASVAALERGEPDVGQAVQTLKTRKDWFLNELTAVPLVKAVVPDGAFYIWMDIREVLGKKFEGSVIQNSKDVANILLEKYYVATVPGIEFGTEGYLRLSFATSQVQLKKAIERFQIFVKALS